ncbi:peptidyl-tRNA hydrolase domain-containing protein 1 [Cladochytrium tenue]|nr:peptidyl-tRNA hydrolase domain-containing protein 1 [Cladochytrium tenue]
MATFVAASAAAVASSGAVGGSGAPLVMYIVVRRDLAKVHKWPAGSMMAQAAHAATAVVATYADHPNTRSYLADLGSMRKIVLETPDEPGLRTLATGLSERGVAHVVWTEQPEGLATCLATLPMPKDALADSPLAACRLFR